MPEKLLETVKDAAAPASLHKTILNDIESRIVSGEWPPGFRIPFEHELSAQYKCSRMTVSKVLTQLANSGMIKRRRKSGSFVQMPVSQSAALEIRDIKAEVEAAGLAYRFTVLSRKVRKTAKADVVAMDIALGAPVLEISCQHFAGARPFCFERRLINLEAVPEAEDESFAEIAPGPWLVRRVPWREAEHKIQATLATAELAAQLGIDVGAACLVIERRTWSAETPLTFVRLYYAGESHELIARFAPARN